MIGRAINLFAILAVLSSQAARAAPIDSHVEQLSQNFRSSVAQAIRDNVARQQLTSSDSANYNYKTAPQLTALPTAAAIVPAIHAPQPADSNEIIHANISADAVAADAQSAIEAEQAKNAHYSFDTSVKDTINDHSQTRQETR